MVCELYLNRAVKKMPEAGDGLGGRPFSAQCLGPGAPHSAAWSLQASLPIAVSRGGAGGCRDKLSWPQGGCLVTWREHDGAILWRSQLKLGSKGQGACLSRIWRPTLPITQTLIGLTSTLHSHESDLKILSVHVDCLLNYLVEYAEFG